MTSSSIETFQELGLADALLTALNDVGYETPSPIQAECIPLLLAGRDLLGEAQTGTGKTAAFALPLLHRLDLSLKAPQVLVLTPTRELAIQVAEAFRSYARHLPGFQVLPVYGGQSMVVQLRQLHRGAHVVVGTPGRVMDHLERQSLSLEGLRALVLDEADEMLRMGFIDDVEFILEHTPSTRQTALFSATMPEEIRRVAHGHLRDAQEVKIRSKTTTVAAISQRYWHVSGMHKIDALTRILEVEDDFDAGIVFVRTKTATVEVAEKLEARGYACAALNGDMNQALRERTIELLKNKSLDLVVATDVAARGLDVPRISHVINYDIPYDTEAYVHRIGRTGRAGRQGSAILFVEPREKRMLRTIERATGQKIEPLKLPSMADVAGRRASQFKQQVLDVLAAEDLEFFQEIVSQMEEEHEVAPADIAAALAFMVQKERPLRPEGHDVEETEEDRRGNRDEILAKRRSFSEGRLERYRIAVGRNQGATPKDIVGAIANEAGLDSRHIGQINLYDDYSTVELPGGMPEDILRLLQKVRVRRCPLNIRPMPEGSMEREQRKPRQGHEDEARPRRPRYGAEQDQAPRAQRERSEPRKAKEGGERKIKEGGERKIKRAPAHKPAAGKSKPRKAE